MSPPASPTARAAVAVGSAAAFLAAVLLIGSVRLALLLDPDPAWVVARLLLGLLVVCGAVLAGGIAAALVFILDRDLAFSSDLPALPLPTGVLAATACLVLVLGAAVRLAALEELPFSLWHDDLLVVPHALSLEGKPSDFHDSVRTITDNWGRPKGTVGVLYLEAFRLVLRRFGTTVLGMRFPSALGGILSIMTAMLLGRALLPRGGGTLAGLVLAGLRWHLILSRWAWVLIFVAPILDLATLAALRARRKGSRAAAAVSGAVAGVGTHVYLSAWIASAALLLLLLWPGGGSRKVRLPLALIFAAAFGAVALPLFLLKEGRQAPYFVRASHNVLVEARLTRSAVPVATAAANALLAPWFLTDPTPRNDLPGRRRLPFLLSVALAVSFLRALVRPRGDLSALLLAHAGTALVACVAWGEQLSPNGSRFGYLTTVTAVGVAAGFLWFLGLVLTRWRRVGAWVVVGGLAVAGAQASSDLVRWGQKRETYDSFVGQQTSVGQSAARWRRYGEVRIEPSRLYSARVVETIRRYGILPRREATAPAVPPSGSPRRFRLCPPVTRPSPGERVVERVRDGWGREWAIVIGQRR
ncbi:MAG: hypothetical protein ACRD1P_03770 [Thermoanaerobaculia bacterium]